MDDCQFNVVAIQSLMSQFDEKSDFCNNGKEAIAAVKARIDANLPPYNLIMMDFSMPECDGPTATKIIRLSYQDSGCPKDKQPFISCLSAYSEKSHKKLALSSGFDCFLVKPIFKKNIHALFIQAGLIK